MKQMEAEAPAAAKLLRLMAFLAPEPVARDWLSEGAEHLSEAPRELVTDQLAWNRSLRVFRRYGPVEVNEGALVMHRLVQVVTRDRLSADERQAWAAAVQAIDAAYPDETYSPEDISDWSRCAALLEHAITIADYTSALSVAPEAGNLLSQIGSYYFSQGRYEEALPVSTRALKIDEAALGDQGRFNEAEPLYQGCLAILDATLGPHHPNTQQVRRNYDRFLQQRDAAS